MESSGDHEERMVTEEKANSFHCSFLDSLPENIRHIIGWKCPIKSGILLIIYVAIDIMIRTMSVVSVVAYLGLTCIIVSIVLRAYSQISASDGDSEHPLKKYMDNDMKNAFYNIGNCIQNQLEDNESHIYRALYRLRKLMLLDSFYDVAKLSLSLLAMVYVGRVFSLQDLALLVTISVMVGPKVYCLYRVQIDTGLKCAMAHAMVLKDKVMTKVSSLPVIGSKAKKA